MLSKVFNLAKLIALASAVLIPKEKASLKQTVTELGAF